jgi:hypothetical protein
MATKTLPLADEASPLAQHTGLLFNEIASDAIALDYLFGELIVNADGDEDTYKLVAMRALVQRIGSVADDAADALGGGTVRDHGGWNYSGALLDARIALKGAVGSANVIALVERQRGGEGA